MSNFLIFKAAFNGSATPAIGTYTAEGATAQFNKDTSISPDYYLYNTVLYSAVQWFIPTAETTDFEFVADILTRYWDNRITYFIIADSTGTTRLRMWSVNDNWHFENSDSITTSGTEYIGTIRPSASGGFGVFHQFRVRVRKLTESSSSVEVYVDGTLKLTATAGAALVTCAKIGFVGGVNSFGPGTDRGVKNAYVYDLSDGDVVNPGVLSGAFNRFISWMKSKFALKSDIPTVNNGALTIQKNGTNVATFTANASTNATANITVPTKTSDLTNDSGFITSDDTKIPLAGSNQISGSLIPSTDNSIDIGSSTKNIKAFYTKGITIDGKTVDTDANGNITYDGHIVDTIEEQGEGYIRYSNGLQICWGSVTWQSDCSRSWGSLYETSRIIGSYAKSFVNTPSVSVLGSIEANSGIVECSSIGTQTLTPTIYLCRATPVNDVATCVISYVAIGRWK